MIQTRISRRARSVAVGLIASRFVPEVSNSFHPVAWFGKAMGRVEEKIWADRRSVGVSYTAAGACLGQIAGTAVRSAAPAVAVSTAGPQLRRLASAVEERLDAGDLDGARIAVGALVGRETSSLDESAVAAAAIESVAENMVDSVLGPVVWGLVGGAPAVAIHRAINTMDAMVGHRNDRYERFGWASAKTDDLAAYVPARLFAVLVALHTPAKAAQILETVRRDAPAHPSPNAGVAESAVAAALGRSLGGTLRYGDTVEHRPTLGSGDRPTAADIGAVNELTRRIETTLAIALGALSIVALLRRGAVSPGRP